MQLFRCTLTLQESVYFATREMGTLYETGRYLHNFALSFAFLTIAISTCPIFATAIAQPMLKIWRWLQQSGIYVTPALPLQVDYLLATWKIGQVNYYRKSEQFGGRNYPANIGRAKELAPESTFRCYILSAEPITPPRWIRLGKWHSKVLVEFKDVPVKQSSGKYVAACPLNPLGCAKRRAARLAGYHLDAAVEPGSQCALRGRVLRGRARGRAAARMQYTLP